MRTKNILVGVVFIIACGIKSQTSETVSAEAVVENNSAAANLNTMYEDPLLRIASTEETILISLPTEENSCPGFIQDDDPLEGLGSEEELEF